mgnify:CR=1 FL=1
MEVVLFSKIDLKKVKINYNRKVLADLAALEPESFKQIVAKVKAA